MDTNNLHDLEPIYCGVDIPNGSKWSTQIKQQAAVIYCLYGNTRRVSELMGVPRNTIIDWCQTEWWQKLVNMFREENKTELNASYSRLLSKTINLIEKQIDNQEVKALDMAKIHGIFFDKRQILNNQPTSINGKTKEISDLAAEFERFIQAKTIDINVTNTDK